MCPPTHTHIIGTHVPQLKTHTCNATPQQTCVSTQRLYTACIGTHTVTQPYIRKEECPLCLFHLEAFDLLLNPLVLFQLLLCGPLTVQVGAEKHTQANKHLE